MKGASTPRTVGTEANALLSNAIDLHQGGRLAEAQKLYEQILQKHPDHFDALHLLGVISIQTGRFAEAEQQIGRALKINPSMAQAHSNYGAALQWLNRLEEALASHDKAIALSPHFAEAHFNRGNALAKLKRLEEALVSYDQAIAVQPDYAEAYAHRGNVLRELRRLAEAIPSYDRAITLRSDYAEAHNGRGSALRDLRRLEEALVSHDQAIAVQPDYAEAYADRGNVLRELRRFEEAIASYDRALALKPDLTFFAGERLQARMQICDWSQREAEVSQLRQDLELGLPRYLPFVVLSLSSRRKEQLQAARIFAQEQYAGDCTLAPPVKVKRDKVRVGYFSSDFRNHAVAWLIAEIIEKHDRNLFEIIGFSFGVDTKDETRRRLASAFDKFIDVRNQSDRDATILARNLGIDIAIDLNGFTANNRTGLFAQRVAPIQVNYLGYPGTMGVNYMDYLIADPILIPVDHRQDYSEKIVYLPDSYQPNDRQRTISSRAITRSEAGLPEKGLVFCCFNNNYKITPEVFDCWMRILKRVPGSVLWLLEDSAATSSNLRAEALQRGVEPERLVFAARMALPEHLARHRLADLFLDTLPYNAHTTASDALWAGLPLVTQLGETFAGRVAASLLNAVGLPELITSTQEAYEERAVELATDGARLQELKRKLAANRLTTPLFDSERYTRHLEAAYMAILERHQAGQPPDHIHVPGHRPDPGSLTALLESAIACHTQGKLAEAQNLYEQILQKHPDHFDALHLLGMISARTGQLSQAAKRIAHAIEVNPAIPEAHNNLGSVLKELKRLDEAVASYDKAIVLRPDFADAHNNRGITLYAGEQLDQALQSFDMAIRIKPDFADAYNNRGTVLQKWNRFEEALASYDRALSLKPDYAEAHNNRGNTLKELGHAQEALTSHDRAISLKPEYAEAHNSRGIALFELKKLEEALTSYERAIALKPDFAEAYINRGITLQTLRQLEQALANYDRAIALRPGLAEAHNSRGNALEELKRLEEALDSYDKAIALKPSFAEASSNRGIVLQALGKLEQAVESYRRAIALKPNHAEFHYNLGNALMALGRDQAALHTYKKALDLKPDFEDALFQIARLTSQDIPSAPPASYVVKLFDNYADQFDEHLYSTLKYRAHEYVVSSFLEHAPEGPLDILDLGCGTGLLGALLAKKKRLMIGVDLSTKMINKARERNIYDELIVGDIANYLFGTQRRYTSVFASDVLIYVGDLAALFQGVRRCLNSAGLFSFSVERCTSGDFMLNRTGRYSHSKNYIGHLARAALFSVLSVEECVLRVGSGKDVPGYVFVLQAVSDAGA